MEECDNHQPVVVDKTDRPSEKSSIYRTFCANCVTFEDHEMEILA